MSFWVDNAFNVSVCIYIGHVDLVSVPQSDHHHGCPSTPHGRELSLIRDNISTIILSMSVVQEQCGPGLWNRVAYLNVNISSQTCPPAWRQYITNGKSTNGVRACGWHAYTIGCIYTCDISIQQSIHKSVVKSLATRCPLLIHFLQTMVHVPLVTQI